MSLLADKELFMDHTNSQDLEQHFKQYCAWCWKHGFGDCAICKKEYNKLYIPMRKRELQEKLGLIKEDTE